MTKHICLDRGFTSVQAMSRNFYHGKISLLLARLSGWDADPAAAVCALADKVHFTLFSAVNDQVIKKAKYIDDPRLLGSSKIQIAAFDPPYVLTVNRSTLHSSRIDFILKQYLVEKHTTFILENQNDLATQVVLNALRSKGCKIPKYVRSKKLEGKKNK